MTANTVPVASRARSVVLGLLALVAAALATTAVALGALALGADPAFMPLHPQAYLTFAVLGTLAALVGWILVVRFAPRSARTLSILVPVLLVLSWLPDVVLLATGFIPGATPVGVVALMLMHPLCAAAAVVAGRMIAPPR